MTIKVAINGYGRIGRNVLRAHYEDGKKQDVKVFQFQELEETAAPPPPVPAIKAAPTKAIEAAD